MDSGWYPDPTGRADRRWWDGTRWTKLVERGGQQLTDDVEIVTTPSPAAAPPPVPPGSDPAPARAPVAFGPWIEAQLDQLGPTARGRPAPKLYDGLLAGAGVLLAVGIVLIGGGNGSSTTGMAIAAILVLAGCYAAALFGSGWYLPAVTAAVAVGIVAVVFAIFNGMVEDGDWALPLFLVAVLAVAAYLAPGLRGRTFLLGLGLASLLFSIAWAVADSSISDSGQFDADVSSGLITSASRDGAIVMLIIGALYAAAAMWLDRHGYRGVATAFVVGAILGLSFGATGAVSDAGELLQALLLLVTGALLAVVGHLGSRRATMWIGAAFVTLGAALLVVAIASDGSITVQGFLIALAGAGLVVLAWWLLRKRPLDRFAAPDQAGAARLRPPAPPAPPRPPDLRPPDWPQSP